MENVKNPVIETVEGKLRGCVRRNLDGEEIYCFLGVKYAKPPIGDLRFKAPQPIEHWTGVRNALQEGEPFIQRDMLKKALTGSEDGLHLNVFTKKPIPDSSQLNPVMVWIHGGSFVEGRNNIALYGPDYLLTEDIVLVSINYRLGILGFLSFEDPSLEVCSNAGLKDQVEALKWVQRNIKNFGGDPNNVTIFGESAGGTMVNYHMMSPLSEGLFHKGIMQSGTLLAFWAEVKNHFKEFMDFIGKSDLTEKEQLNYLRNLPIKELFDYYYNFTNKFPLKNLKVVGPIVEKPSETAFFTPSLINQFVSGNFKKIPILLGYNSNECMAYPFISKDPIPSNGMGKAEIISWLFDIRLKKEDIEKFNKKLNKAYSKKDIKEDYYLWISDLFFIISVVSAARILSRASDKPVYLYRMSLDANLNFLKKILRIDKYKGAVHMDDCGYLFNNAVFPHPKKGTLEDISVRRFVKMWTNFAKYGNPTPEDNDLNIIWKPYNENEEYYLEIDNELLLRNNPDSERIKLWKEIFQTNPKTANYL